MKSEETMKNAKQAVKAYLDSRAKVDTQFAVAYAKPGKSLDECFRYILLEARKLGREAWVSDETVFGWAVHYYDEDDIRVPAVAPAARVARTAEQPALTEEEKADAHRRALEEYKQQCVAKMEQAEREKARKAAEERKARAEARKALERGMPTLFPEVVP